MTRIFFIMFRKSYFLFLLLVLCLPSPLRAELFKWVDENGKVHYSDKEPKKQVRSSVIPVKPEPTFTTQVHASAGEAIIRPYERSSRKLFLLDTKYIWRKYEQSRKSRKVGAYHVGKGCTSRGAIKVPDALITHKGFFPDEKNLAYTISKVVNSLDYSAERIDRYKLLKNLKKTGGLSLHSEVIDLDINSCAPSISTRERLKPISEISSGRFKKHRVNLTVRWQLKANRDQDVLYENTTTGYYNGWNVSTSAAEAFNSAIEDATLLLFSDRAFVDRILVEEIDRKLAAADANSIESPILQPQTNRTHPMYLSLASAEWSNKVTQGAVNAELYFGGNCAARKTLAYKDSIAPRPWVPAAKKKQLHNISKRMQGLGYALKPAANDTRTRLHRSGGYLLRATIDKIDYQSCAPAMSAASKYMDKDKLKRGKFTRHRAKVMLTWRLVSPQDQSTLMQKTTLGVAGDLINESTASQIMDEAFTNAADQLFADQRFVNAVVRKDRTITTGISDFPPTDSSAPSGLVRPKGSTSRKIFLVFDEDPWKRLGNGKQIGIYAYGENCATYAVKSWPDAVNDHPKMFPKANELLESKGRVLKALDYDYSTTDAYNVLKLKRKLGGYSLHARILDLRFDSCAPEVEDEQIYAKKKVYDSNFKRHRVRLELQWRLMGASDNDLLFETRTVGAADSWQLNSPAKKLFAKAAENATRSLFSQAEFIALITHDESQLAEHKSDEGILSRLFSFVSSDNDKPSISLQNNFLLRAQLGEVMVELNSLKVAALSHYMERGEWPAGLSDVGLTNSAYNDSKVIDSVALQSDGTIIAELAGQFGSNKILQLEPLENRAARGISWRCSSNLAQTLLPNNCEAL